MDVAEIEVLLQPYLGERTLTSFQLELISTYVNIFIKWNERTNLTSIRNPREIVQRHFGESLFAATQLLAPDSRITTADVGSGAGFPGLPLKIFVPDLQLTLIEAHSKKNTFLREVVRSLELSGVEVLLSRAEQVERRFQLVTMRAVEQFSALLPILGRLVTDDGRLALMIGENQRILAVESLPGEWADPIRIPNSTSRILLVRRRS